MVRYLGIAAVFTWLALIFYNMTQDSLAIPNLWINLGVLVGLSSAGIIHQGEQADGDARI
jgi:hypothetical protein